MEIRTICDATLPANVIERIHHTKFTLYSLPRQSTFKRHRGIYAETTVIFNGTAREFSVAFPTITEGIYRGRKELQIREFEMAMCITVIIDSTSIVVSTDAVYSHLTHDSHLAKPLGDLSWTL